MHTRVVGIIRYMVHPYRFSSNGISVKSSRDVLCTLLSLLPLYDTQLEIKISTKQDKWNIVFWSET